jgi:hypothetical protein
MSMSRRRDRRYANERLQQGAFGEGRVFPLRTLQLVPLSRYDQPASGGACLLSWRSPCTELTLLSLQTRTPYLEGYLAREPTTLEKTDLLWQFYVRTSRYASAASVLASLAESLSLPLSLQKRVEYLSLAVGNAKSQIPSSSRGDAVQFLTDVEEKLEVAQVQIEIFRAIEEGDLPADEKQQWLEKVEERLLTISELYSEFAEPLGLLEIILLIVRLSPSFSLTDKTDFFLPSSSTSPTTAIHSSSPLPGRRFSQEVRSHPCFPSSFEADPPSTRSTRSATRPSSRRRRR